MTTVLITGDGDHKVSSDLIEHLMRFASKTLGLDIIDSSGRVKLSTSIVVRDQGGVDRVATIWSVRKGLKYKMVEPDYTAKHSMGNRINAVAAVKLADVVLAIGACSLIVEACEAQGVPFVHLKPVALG